MKIKALEINGTVFNDVLALPIEEKIPRFTKRMQEIQGTVKPGVYFLIHDESSISLKSDGHRNFVFSSLHVDPCNGCDASTPRPRIQWTVRREDVKIVKS